MRWVFDVDKVIAWRPSPADAVEEPLAPGEPADYRKNLPREYLVKWDQLGFRHVECVALCVSSPALLVRLLTLHGPLSPQPDGSRIRSAAPFVSAPSSTSR